MQNVKVKNQFNEKEFWKNFHEELQEIENEIEEENNVLKVFQGKVIDIDKFKKAMADNEKQSMNIEMFFNSKCITAQFYDNLELEIVSNRITLDDEGYCKPSMNIWLEDIDEIQEGYGIMCGHWLIRSGSFEYFIYEGL